MKCRLVKLDDLSGKKASVYSIIISGESETLYEKFIQENLGSFKSELLDINTRLNVIGKRTGARDHFFKSNEGKFGDGICALYDDPEKHLRLYCIKFWTQIVVLGGGGPKFKNIRALQEDEKLTKENYFLRDLSKRITEKILEKDIAFSSDYLNFIGDLEFNYEDED